LSGMKWHPGCLANNLPVRGDIPSQVLESVQADLGSMPQRQILDFLVQYFVSELNWYVFNMHGYWPAALPPNDM
jgi:hypothetical protein